MKLLLKAGAIIVPPPHEESYRNRPAFKQNTHPLHIAIRSKHLEAVQCLLDAFCGKVPLHKKNPDSHELLALATLGGDLKIFNLLLARGAEVDSRNGGLAAIHYAAETGNLQMLKTLVEKGANIEANGAVEGDDDDEEDEGNDWSCYESEPRDDWRPLSRCQDPGCIRYLLEKGANIHCLPRKSPPISAYMQLSLFSGIMGICSRGRGRGFDFGRANQVKIKDSVNICVDQESNMSPPYVKVITSGNVEAVKPFFDKCGAKICKNEKIFNVACFSGQYNIVKYLVAKHPDLLLKLSDLSLLLSKGEIVVQTGADERFEVGEIKPDRFGKMVGTLLDLGCSFDFKPKKSDMEVASFLSMCYDTQRFVFAKILQELCGRKICISSAHLLHILNIVRDKDYDMVRLLIKCGHTINNRHLAPLRKQNMLSPQESRAFCAEHRKICRKPLDLQSLCRIHIRTALFQGMKKTYCHINKLIEKLPADEPIQDFLCFSGHFELSYLK
jgi:hypothetical protein